MPYKWSYFEVVIRDPEGGVCRTGTEAPNRRHAVGMVLKDLPAGHVLVSVRHEDELTPDDRGYHGI